MRVDGVLRPVSGGGEDAASDIHMQREDIQGEQGACIQVVGVGRVLYRCKARLWQFWRSWQTKK